MPDALRFLALSRVEELLLQGYRPQQILDECKEYTESIRTIYAWCEEIYRRWAEEDQKQRPARRDLWRARLEARYRMMLEDLADPTMKMTGINRAKLYDAMAKLELLAIKLDGLDAPIRIEHSGAIDVRAMSPEQRRERIDELLARRERAKAQLEAGSN